MQFYLFDIGPKLHHRKWWKLRITLFQTFSTSPAACWCCSSSNLYPETLVINCWAFEPLHSYRLLIKILSSLFNGTMLTGSVTRNLQNSHYFWCPFWKTKSDKKQTYTETEADKVYCRVFWIFLPNVNKIDPHNYYLYSFTKLCVFLRQSVVYCIVNIWNSLPSTAEDFACIRKFKCFIELVDLSRYVNF